MSKKSAQGHMEFAKWFGPILDALRALGDSAKPKEVQNWLINSFNLPDDVINERYEKSGGLKFPNQVAFARQYLIWEGLIDGSERGIWALTPKGKVTSLDYDSSYQIALKWIKYFQQLRDEKPKPKKDKAAIQTEEGDHTEIPQDPEIIDTPSLLELLQQLPSESFEHLCGRLLREYGFEQVKITQRTRDGGIDGYGILKTNPFVSLSVAFQCKRWNNATPVGSKDVQALIGANDTSEKKCEKVMLITTSSFTKDALRIAETSSKIELIDGDLLVKMFENVQLGVIAKTIYEPNIEFFKQYLEPMKNN